jgi:ankyrin repeat protein
MADFVDAAACGDLDGVRELLADATLSAVVINAIDKDGRSAFHYACLNDDSRLLTVLLAEQRVDVSLRSQKGDTGMHMAALYAALEALKLLLADARTAALLDAQNDFGETPLHLSAGSGDGCAAKAAGLLLAAGAPLWATDKWNRGPRDVSRDNAENPLVVVFEAHLAGADPSERAKVDAVTAAYKAESEAAATHTADAVAANKASKNAIFGQLGGVKLKKTKTKVKGMFRKKKKKKKKNAGEGGAAAAEPAAAGVDARTLGDGRRALSKLVDFPGDLEAIKGHLANVAGVDPAGRDAYGLTALHKFASWNKTEFLELLIEQLDASVGELDAQCPDGKTAVHWAVEMAAAGALKTLVAAGCRTDLTDGRGRTPLAVLEGAAPSGVITRLIKALTGAVPYGSCRGVAP